MQNVLWCACSCNMPVNVNISKAVMPENGLEGFFALFYRTLLSLMVLFDITEERRRSGLYFVNLM